MAIVRPHRILVIDDNPDIHRDFQRILVPEQDAPELAQRRAAILGERPQPAAQKTVCELTHALQGQEGHERVVQAMKEDHPYAVAFVDMRMPPGWDGLETIERMWKVDPQLQVVICTAYADYSQEEITERLGATDRLLILKKPFDGLEVTQLVLTLTERAQIEQALRENQERLELAISGASLATWDWDMELDRLVFNERLTEILGYEQDELDPHIAAWELLTHPDDLTLTGAKLRAHLKGKTTSFEAEFRIRPKTGAYVWVLDRGKVVHRDASGKALRMAGTIVDITARKLAQLAQQESEKRFQRLMENMPLPLAVIDPEENIEYLNGKFVETLGYTRESIPTLNEWWRLAYPDEEHRHAMTTQWTAAVAKAQRDKADIETREYHITCKNGTVRLMEFFATFIGNRQLVVLRDVTASKKAEEALRLSEEKYRTLADSLPLVIFEVDLSSRFTFINEYGLNFAGYTQADLDRGLTGLKVVTPKYRDLLRENLEIVLAGGVSVGNEYVCVRKDGTTYPCIIYATRILSGGMTIGARGVVVDITERKQAEQALHESVVKYRTLADSLPLAVFESDLTGRVTFINEYGLRFMGYTKEALTQNRTIAEAISPEDHAALRENFVRVLNGEKSPGNEYTAVKRDGTRFPCVIYSSPILVDDKPVGTRGVLIDITERKRAEEGLEAAHRELLDTARQAGMAEVATGVLHNVGNVLNSVGVAVTTMEHLIRNSRLSYLDKVVQMLGQHDGHLDEFLASDERGRRLPSFLEELSRTLREERERFAETNDKLKTYVQHVTEIINLQQSYGRTASVRESALLSEVVEDALRINADGLKRHGVTVKQRYATIPPVIFDRGKMLQIMTNLISNAKYALKNCRKEQKMLEVRIAEPNSGAVRIEVSDNGIGIAAEDQTRIFGYGFTTRSDGHGFGLHSGALAAQEMEGALAVGSDGPGKGATFILEIPFTPGGPKNVE